MLLTPCAQLMKSTACMPSILMSRTCSTCCPCSLAVAEVWMPAPSVSTPSSNAVDLMRFMCDSRVLAGRRDTRHARLRPDYGRGGARGNRLPLRTADWALIPPEGHLTGLTAARAAARHLHRGDCGLPQPESAILEWFSRELRNAGPGAPSVLQRRNRSRRQCDQFLPRAYRPGLARHP